MAKTKKSQLKSVRLYTRVTPAVARKLKKAIRQSETTSNSGEFLRELLEETVV